MKPIYVLVNLPCSVSYPLIPSTLPTSPKNGRVPLNQPSETPPHPPPAARSPCRNGYGRRLPYVPLLRLRPAAPPPPDPARGPAPGCPGGTGRAVREERQAEEAAALRARAPRAALHVRGRRALRPRTTPSLSSLETMCTLSQLVYRIVALD